MNTKFFVASVVITFMTGTIAQTQEIKANERAQVPGSEIDCALNLIKSRRSVRNFFQTPVPKDHILRIIDAARSAPTSGNQQPWKFLIVQDRSKLDLLVEELANYRLQLQNKDRNLSNEERNAVLENGRNFARKYLSAPVSIVILTDSKSEYPAYNHWDGPLAAGYLMLAARAFGYGTVFITDAINFEVVRKVFAIPEQYEIVCVTPLGVPVRWPESPAKKSLDSFVVFESFGRKKDQDGKPNAAKESAAAFEALYEAATMGDRQAVEAMLRTNPELVSATDKYGFTALHGVAGQDEPEIAELLIARGANVSAQNDEGITPLHIAQYASIIEVLIRHGADVNARAKNGWTPLHVQSQEGEETGALEAMEALLAAKADPNIKDKHGNTPLTFARKRQEPEKIEMLLANGAK